MTQIHLFASGQDWLSIFDLAESQAELKYASYGQHASQTIEEFRQGSELPNLGRASGEQQAACDSWVVAYAETPLELRPIERTDGATWFAMDQLWNPATAVLNTGGVWQEGTLISGTVGTTAASGPGLKLQRLFAARVKRLSARVGSFWVAPEAQAWLEAGWRLCTASVQSSSEYDLR